jgi:hypothetical protein
MKQIAQWNAFVRIVRFHEYGPSYLFSALACGSVAKFPVDSKLLPVLLFVHLADEINCRIIRRILPIIRPSYDDEKTNSNYDAWFDVEWLILTNSICVYTTRADERYVHGREKRHHDGG